MCVWDGRAHEGAKTESPLFPSRSGNPGNRIKTASSFCVILSSFLSDRADASNYVQEAPAAFRCNRE